MNLDDLIAQAPDTPPPPPPSSSSGRQLSQATGFYDHYRPHWPRPTDDTWTGNFIKSQILLSLGGILVICGNRGTGKTRLAAEIAREIHPRHSRYTTALQLILRLQDTFRDDSTESEFRIIRGLTQAPLVVIDEWQERKGTSFEDIKLTSIIDARHGARRPTIILTNLIPDVLQDPENPLCLNSSIIDRIQECGAILQLTGTSHRGKS